MKEKKIFQCVEFVFVENGIVHGTYLLGLVSGIMGTKCPGPGTKVVEIQARFPSPCPMDSDLKISVQIEDVRKLASAKFEVKSEDDVVCVQGSARLILPATKNC